MYLYQALRFTENEIAAFVGAGGKTSAIFTIARELVSNGIKHPGKSVIVTITTHLGEWQSKFADHSFEIHSVTDLNKFERAIPKGVSLLFGGIDGNRLTGLDNELLMKLAEISSLRRIPLLIEADGSRGRPLKAPDNSEPVIPEFVNSVVVVAGLSGIGKPLNDEWVHRPEIFSELSGLRMGETITSEAVATVLLQDTGGIKNIPSKARKILLLNQADNAELQAEAKVIALEAINKFSSIIVTSINQPSTAIDESISSVKIFGVIEKIGGIILAAGSSSRFGIPKQLLKWGSEPFIRHLAGVAVKAGLSPVLIVLGYDADEIGETISDLPVKTIYNPEWHLGMSTSIKVGLKQLPDRCGGVIFLNADQPQTPVSLLLKLIEEHGITMAPIVAPQIDGERGNPVLFDQSTFEKLMKIEGDIGGRVLFQKYPIRWIPWHDRMQLLDIDTPEEYKKFLEVNNRNGE